jgi:general stress protein 26
MAVETITDREAAVKKLGDLIKDIHIAMLTTEEDDGTLRSRPMGTQQVEFDGDLWFFNKEHSPKVKEVQHERNVNVSYADPKGQTYVSVSGKASLVNDHQKMEELWNPILKAWFPKGLEDPELSLLKVEVEEAEYWDSPNGAVVQIAGFVKAIVTGKQAQGGENKKMELK